MTMHDEAGTVKLDHVSLKLKVTGGEFRMEHLDAERGALTAKLRGPIRLRAGADLQKPRATFCSNGAWYSEPFRHPPIAQQNHRVIRQSQ